MTATVRTVKFSSRESVELDGLTYQNGELYYDQTNMTLRLMDSLTRGGTKLATRPWVNDDLQTLNNTISFTNTQQSTSKITGAVKIAGGVGIVKNLYVGGDLVVDGVISLGNATNIANDFSVSTDRFQVDHITGNGLFAGTLTIGSDFKINTTKFVVTAASGNTSIAGTLDLANDLRVNTNKFVASYSTGNVSIAGDLTLTGNITTEIKALRNFSVATNKFTVDYLTGNTLVAGTLGVTGLSTLATAQVSDLTAGRITYAGTLGRLKDSAELTWDESELYVAGNIHTTGNLTVDGDLTLSGTTITLGNSNADNLTITADLVSDIIPNATNTYDLGTSTKRWKKLWANTVDVSGATNLDGNLTIGTDKFTVNASTGAAVHGGSVTVNGTLTVNGPTVTTTTSNVTTSSSVIEVHTSAEPLAVDDGKDLGVVIHYYKSVAEQLAFLGWKNTTQELVYYTGATYNLGVYTGTLGTIKAASFTTADAGSFKANGSGGITTALTSLPLVNDTATTINFGGAATNMNIGAQSGTTTIQNPTVLGTQTTQNLWNTVATTINFGGGAATGVNIGNASGTTLLRGLVNIGGATGGTVPLGVKGVASYAGINVQAILSDTTTAGIGNGGCLAFEGKYSTGGDLANFGAIAGIKENANDANYAGAVAIYTRLNGSLPVERFRVASDGKIQTQGATNGPADMNIRSNTGQSNSGSLSLAASALGGAGASYILMGNNDSSGTAGPAIIQSSNRTIQFGVGNSWTDRTGGTYTNAMTLEASGNLTVVGTITEQSSIVYKENVNPITGALDLIKRLEGVTYDRRNGSAKNEAGLIAEAVDKVIPNIVKHDSNGNPEGINYTKLTAYLIEAVKELTEKVERLSK